jgi:hypothetical protein
MRQCAQRAFARAAPHTVTGIASTLAPIARRIDSRSFNASARARGVVDDGRGGGFARVVFELFGICRGWDLCVAARVVEGLVRCRDSLGRCVF